MGEKKGGGSDGGSHLTATRTLPADSLDDDAMTPRAASQWGHGAGVVAYKVTQKAAVGHTTHTRLSPQEKDQNIMTLASEPPFNDSRVSQGFPRDIHRLCAKLPPAKICQLDGLLTSASPVCPPAVRHASPGD